MTPIIKGGSTAIGRAKCEAVPTPRPPPPPRSQAVELAPLLPPSDELVRRVIAHLRAPPLPRRSDRPLWTAVVRTFGLGSTYATILCRRHGFNPDERVRR